MQIHSLQNVLVKNVVDVGGRGPLGTDCVRANVREDDVGRGRGPRAADARGEWLAARRRRDFGRSGLSLQIALAGRKACHGLLHVTKALDKHRFASAQSIDINENVMKSSICVDDFKFFREERAHCDKNQMLLCSQKQGVTKTKLKPLQNSK